jgi:hypothetical protein
MHTKTHVIIILLFFILLCADKAQKMNSHPDWNVSISIVQVGRILSKRKQIVVEEGSYEGGDTVSL